MKSNVMKPNHFLRPEGIVNDLKYPSVRQRLCRECPFVTIHSTGSQLWTSCRFQDGWRSIDAVCNFSEIPKTKETTK
jgi:hypothetical protein